ncbi:alpha/beta hydrolase [Parashewanella tropica]|uniref:alpha/beta hydrolase n=1 Tax=Parashewanella tropica TaxID=2547970 RepID=UPI00105A1FC4|nr:alpha/beta hydrolase [Parashewanella tropica]
MSSWQASVLNMILSYVAKPSFSRGRSKLPIAEIRNRMLRLDQRWQPVQEDISCDRIELSDSNLLKYHMQHDDHPSRSHAKLFYIRGGGFCFKTPNSHAKFIGDIMRHCHLDAYIPDYRLAPEHPFPAAINDVLEAYQKVIALHPNSPIILMGDSAGGNLAAALLQDIKRLQLPMPKGCVLYSPALDVALLGDAEKTLLVDDPLFTFESLLRLRGAYLNGQNPMTPRISPLLGDWADMPAMLIFAGTRELMLQDSETLAAKIEQAGGKVEAWFGKDMPHVYPLFEMLPEAKQARKQIYYFVQSSLMEF